MSIFLSLCARGKKVKENSIGSSDSSSLRIVSSSTSCAGGE
jgi:hypothetical protein